MTVLQFELVVLEMAGTWGVVAAIAHATDTTAPWNSRAATPSSTQLLRRADQVDDPRAPLIEGAQHLLALHERLQAQVAQAQAGVGCCGFSRASPQSCVVPMKRG